MFSFFGALKRPGNKRKLKDQQEPSASGGRSDSVKHLLCLEAGIQEGGFMVHCNQLEGS
jgi:hypothetical protein